MRDLDCASSANPFLGNMAYAPNASESRIRGGIGHRVERKRVIRNRCGRAAAYGHRTARQIESPQRAAASPVSIADLFYARGSYDASLAPDGRDLVISTNLTGRHNLWRVPLSGGFPTQLTRSDERQFGTAVSPDGKTVVFASDHAGAEMYDLFAVPFEGGPVVNLTSTDDATETGAVFSRDGHWLAFNKRLKTAASANIAVRWISARVKRARSQTRSCAADAVECGSLSRLDGREIIANRSDCNGDHGQRLAH